MLQHICRSWEDSCGHCEVVHSHASFGQQQLFNLADITSLVVVLTPWHKILDLFPALCLIGADPANNLVSLVNLKVALEHTVMGVWGIELVTEHTAVENTVKMVKLYD